MFKNFLKRKENPVALASGRSSEAGFTLIEMMIVISIIALVASFVTTNIMRRFDEAKVSSARIQMKQLELMLDDFSRVCGRYPLTEEGLESLITPPPALNCKNFDPEGFIKGKKVPLDPWNDPYIYTYDGKRPILKSHSEKGTHKDISSDDE